MIGRQKSGGDGGLDLLAVQRDDELLDLLAGRAQLPGDDELMLLLAAWRDEVDSGLAELLGDLPKATALPVDPGPSADLAPAAAEPETSHRHRLTAAGMAAAIVIGGTLSVSGVAAAVTGDPLAPYRAVGEALSLGSDDLPPQAAEIAHFNRRLRGAQSALARGDTEAVARLVDQLTAALATSDLTDKQRATIEHRLAILRAALARQAATDTEQGRSDATARPSAGQGRTKPQKAKVERGGGTAGASQEQRPADERAEPPATGGPENDSTPTDGGDEDGTGPATDPDADASTDPAGGSGADGSDGDGSDGDSQGGDGRQQQPSTAPSPGGGGKGASRSPDASGQAAMSSAGTRGARR